MKAIYNLTTKLLIVTGDAIKNFIETVDEIGEWRTLNDTEGNPIFDIQMDYDDSIDKTETDHTLNPDNYNLQYVNLVVDEFQGVIQGEDWRNIELTIIEDKPSFSLKILGTKKA
jgi:hypothetical protein